MTIDVSPLKSNPTLNTKPVTEKDTIKVTEVTCTVYHPVKSQCDGIPNLTYDSTKIDIPRASGYRIVGVSHDLVEMGYEMGDWMLVYGTGDDYYDGVWRVGDLMNKKWTKAIDFLQSPRNRKYPKMKKCYIMEIDMPEFPDSLIGGKR